MSMTAVLAVAAACLSWPAEAADADQVPRTERINVAPDGVGGNHHSVQPVVSADGRVVAFQSSASNLARYGRTEQRLLPDGSRRTAAACRDAG
ncbi:hypothetical protein [Streptomyces sp. NPDC001139]